MKIVSALQLDLALLVAVACSRPTPFRPACAAEDGARIEADYVAEVVKACKAEGANSLTTCKAAGPIRERARERRAEWVRCGQ